MTNLELLQNALIDLGKTEMLVTDIGDTLDTVDAENLLGDEFNILFDNLSLIRTWIDNKIVEQSGVSVINSFLGELKMVFEKYQAVLTVVEGDATGYGENWGQGGSGGIKFEVTLDGVSASKTFDQSVLTSSDLA
jgi:hypothetical protein